VYRGQWTQRCKNQTNWTYNTIIFIQRYVEDTFLCGLLLPVYVQIYSVANVAGRIEGSLEN